MKSKCRLPFWVMMAVAFVVLQLLDGILTAMGVHFYGMDLEANPLAAALFRRWGVVPAVVVAKGLSFLIFFGLLWYCIKGRWSMLDVVGLLWKRKPRRDRAYAMACFNLAGVITTLASLYAGGGWVYLLLMLGVASR